MNDMAMDADPGRVSLFTNELDEMACRAVEKRRRLGNEVSVLIFGRGVGKAARRMAAAGARVAVDAFDDPPGSASGLRSITLPLAPPPDLIDGFPEAPFDLVLGQLALHPLRYHEARRAVRQLLLSLKIGGKIYLSAYGLHSTLGDSYPDSEKPIQERYGKLPEALADSYGLHGPLCLYTERNLITLLFECGASVLQSATGALGSVRAVAVRV